MMRTHDYASEPYDLRNGFAMPMRGECLIEANSP
jgi:hypothetical protein